MLAPHPALFLARAALAPAWMRVRFPLGKRFRHRGVDAVRLCRGPGGWRAFQLADTRRAACDG